MKQLSRHMGWAAFVCPGEKASARNRGARMKKCLAHGLLIFLLILNQPLLAATITVDNTTCTLVDAVAAAETDSMVGGCAKGTGADTIQLTADVTLTAVNNFAILSNNALPLVTTDITVDGGGFTVQRDPVAPSFRFFAVSATGTLTLNDLTLRNGRATQHGGAIGNNGFLILSNTTLTENSSPNF